MASRPPAPENPQAVQGHALPLPFLAPPRARLRTHTALSPREGYLAGRLAVKHSPFPVRGLPSLRDSPARLQTPGAAACPASLPAVSGPHSSPGWTVVPPLAPPGSSSFSFSDSSSSLLLLCALSLLPPFPSPLVLEVAVLGRQETRPASPCHQEGTTALPGSSHGLGYNREGGRTMTTTNAPGSPGLPLLSSPVFWARHPLPWNPFSILQNDLHILSG